MALFFILWFSLVIIFHCFILSKLSANYSLHKYFSAQCALTLPSLSPHFPPEHSQDNWQVNWLEKCPLRGPPHLPPTSSWADTETTIWELWRFKIGRKNYAVAYKEYYLQFIFNTLIKKITMHMVPILTNLIFILKIIFFFIILVLVVTEIRLLCP